MRLVVLGLIGGIGLLTFGMKATPERASGEAAADIVRASSAAVADPVNFISPADNNAPSVSAGDPRVESVATVDQADPLNVSRQNLTRKVEMLRQGLAFLNSIPGYTANLSKQEEVKGELLEEQTLFIKCRQNPFSVYLRWSTGDEGREVLFIEGANNGKLLGHDGGWKARIPAFYLEPDGPLAMRDTRYPASCAGIRFLIDQMLEVHEGDLRVSNIESCEIDNDAQFDNRPCVKFTTKYQSSLTSPLYRKSVTLFDRERSIALQSDHFTWPTKDTSTTDDSSDSTTLIERYAFRDFEIHQSLTDEDFDRSNKSYNFR